MIEYFNKLYTDSCDFFYKKLFSSLNSGNKMFIVTANPETFMIGQKNTNFDTVLKKESTIIVADGIGIVKAANYLSIPVKEKITGVDIATHLLEFADSHRKSVYLYGAKENVIQALIRKINEKYPNALVCGFQNGYGENDDDVFEDMLLKEPDIVLVALGIPRQELLIDRYFDRFKNGIFVGVGGSFDVISGCKKRAPKIFIKLNLEWLYRIIREPKRLKRFYDSNIHFLSIVRRMRKENGEKTCE